MKVRRRKREAMAMVAGETEPSIRVIIICKRTNYRVERIFLHTLHKT